MFFLSSIYAILILVNVERDLHRFLKEIDMLQIHYGFMGPFDLFLGMRWAIANYRALYNEGNMTEDLFIRLEGWINPKLTLSFDNLKANFIH